MKGIVFDVVADIVRQHHSVSTWDAILVDAGVDGAYSSLGVYPDEELTAIVQAASGRLGASPDDVLRWLGAEAFARLVTLLPEPTATLGSWQQLLLSLDDIVHAEVTRLHPDAITPGLAAAREGDAIVLTYESSRGLCALADGLIVGCGAWYGTPLRVEHLRCTAHGDAACVLRCEEASP